MGRLLGGSMVGLMVTFSKRTFATHRASQVCGSQISCPQGGPLLTRASTGDTQTLTGRSVSVSYEGHWSFPSVLVYPRHFLFAPSEYPWWVWGFILNKFAPLLPSYWGFSFAVGIGIFFLFFIFLVESNILSMVVKQLVATLEFTQEKMSTWPFSLPSCLLMSFSS